MDWDDPRHRVLSSSLVWTQVFLTSLLHWHFARWQRNFFLVEVCLVYVLQVWKLDCWVRSIVAKGAGISVLGDWLSFVHPLRAGGQHVSALFEQHLHFTFLPFLFLQQLFHFPLFLQVLDLIRWARDTSIVSVLRLLEIIDVSVALIEAVNVICLLSLRRVQAPFRPSLDWRRKVVWAVLGIVFVHLPTVFQSAPILSSLSQQVFVLPSHFFMVFASLAEFFVF